ncbi:phage holin family protein [Frankia nepalensis]|nr:phage holin family protein [Frankia nepalensis]
MTRSRRSGSMPPDLDERTYSEERVYPEEHGGAARTPKKTDITGTTVRDDRQAAERPAKGAFPETSRSAVPVSTASAGSEPTVASGSTLGSGSTLSSGSTMGSGSTGGTWSAEEPVITPAGVMPDDIRASAGDTATAVAHARATGTRMEPGRDTFRDDRRVDDRFVGGSQAVADRTSHDRISRDRGVNGRVNGHGKAGRLSAGELMSGVATDMSTLFRKEVQLAKAEFRQSATRAGKGAGMFGGAAGAGFFAALFVLLAVMFGLAEVMALGWAALIVGVILAIVAAVLGLAGRRTVKTVHPTPEQTVETLKEDMRWAHGLRK